MVWLSFCKQLGSQFLDYECTSLKLVAMPSHANVSHQPQSERERESLLALEVVYGM